MALKIVWTSQAKIGLEKVLNYLEKEWTTKEILKLEDNLQYFLNLIQRHPELFPSSTKSKDLRKGLIDKNNYIIYRLHDQENLIEIINFRGTRQNPEP